MLLRISNLGEAATDLGFLLHKNPSNLHRVDLGLGRAQVFYSEAEAGRCTACLLLELDPVELVRGAQQLEDYVNDRPYVASSYFSVAIGRVFGTALSGTCAKRPELVGQALALEIVVEVLRVRGGEEVLRKIFEPLGYRVEAEALVLDEQFPQWGASNYFRLKLSGHLTAHDALSHLYVLLPVLDDQKHYFIGEAEVDKLLRHGEGWLSGHPERQMIISRYLKRKASLMNQAYSRLLEQEGIELEAEKSRAEETRQEETNLERPMTLHTKRLSTVAAKLRELGARRVLDLGCGEGKLLRLLLADKSFERVLGMDVSHRSLEVASDKLRLARMPARQRERIELVQGSLVYRDARLSGYDGAALVEVIEHLDAFRLAALERVLFEFARPRHIVITTPNREYNALFPALEEGRLRHGDHRFEWTRAEFSAWGERVAGQFGYVVSFEPVGPVDDRLGAPTQMGVFSLGTVSAGGVN